MPSDPERRIRHYGNSPLESTLLEHRISHQPPSSRGTYHRVGQKRTHRSAHRSHTVHKNLTRPEKRTEPKNEKRTTAHNHRQRPTGTECCDPRDGNPRFEVEVLASAVAIIIGFYSTPSASARRPTSFLRPTRPTVVLCGAPSYH